MLNLLKKYSKKLPGRKKKFVSTEVKYTLKETNFHCMNIEIKIQFQLGHKFIFSWGSSS